MPSTLTVDATMPWSVVEGSGSSRYVTSASDQYGGEILQVVPTASIIIILYCDHVMYVVVYLLIEEG